MNDDVQLVREIGEVKAELSGLKAEVAGTNQRLDDIVITQLKDHGKRLAMQDIRIMENALQHWMSVSSRLKLRRTNAPGGCPSLLAWLLRPAASARSS